MCTVQHYTRIQYRGIRTVSPDCLRQQHNSGTVIETRQSVIRTLVAYAEFYHKVSGICRFFIRKLVALAEFYQKVSGICRFFIRKFVAFEEFYPKVSDICRVLL